jgi:hypothetical protein
MPGHHNARWRTPASGQQTFAILLCMFATLLGACGISLTEGSSGTEMFTKLTVPEEAAPGEELFLTLDYEQPYQSTVNVECDVLTTAKLTPTPTPTADPLGTPTPTPVRIPAPMPTPANRVVGILADQIGPNAEGSTADEATPVIGKIERRFMAPSEPGRYVVRCFTPLDRDNQIMEELRVREDSQ